MISDVREWLDRVVTVERVTIADDFAQTETWVSVGDVTCYIRTDSGDEEQDYGQTGVRSTHTMYCEFDADITNEDRVIDGTDVYMVRYVDPKTVLGDPWLQVALEYVGAQQ